MTKNEKLQAVFQLYASEHGYEPATARDAVAWGVEQGMLPRPKKIDPLDLLTAQMASALGQEYDTHNGRRYRVNHAVRLTQNGEQQTFWAMMGYASHEHMERAFGQRREHIVGECVQLNNDITVYNQMNAGKRPEIQLVLNFANDVAERETEQD